jgi:hypothetical protein
MFFEEDSMHKKSHITGSVVLLLISLIVFLGCPMETPLPAAPQEDKKDDDNSGDKTDAEKNAETAAADLAAAWGKAEGAVTVSGTTVTLKKDLIVTGMTPAAPGPQNIGRPVIASEGDKYYVSVSPIPAGVTVEVPVSRSLQVGQGSADAITLEIAGKIEVKKGASGQPSDGKLIIGSRAVLTTAADSDAKITVTGTLSGAGDLTVTSGALEVSKDATVESNSGGTLTVTVKTAGKVTVAKEITSSGMSGVSIIVEKGGTIEASKEVVRDCVTNKGGNMSVPDTEITASLPTLGTYTVQYYNAEKKVVQLKDSSNGSMWYSTAANPASDALFNAIYTPNAPGSTRDDVSKDPGKSAVEYTSAVSTAVLNLFKVTFDGSSVTKVEITGEPPDENIVSPAASNSNLIIIDIGLPEGNTGLPKFSIPFDNTGRGTLGSDDGSGSDSYSYIRLRVNPGADMTIAADNSAYENTGAGHSCPVGRFGGGCVEVMAGGKLRDGAYEGFPLGSNAVILSRAGSYLSVGPESHNSEKVSADAQKYFAGCLIGPEDGSPRIKWDAGNTGYIEVRPSKLAISGDVTVQKTLGLIYSVWFDNNTTVTIDVVQSDTTPTIMGNRGLFANGTTYKFYGTSTAKIIVKKDSVLHKAFLTSDGTDIGILLKGKDGGNSAVTGTTNSGDPARYPDPTSGQIERYPTWTVNTGDESDSIEVVNWPPAS